MDKTKIGMICVGSELLRYSVNTNVHLVNEFLKGIGAELSFDITVPDNIGAIKSALEFYAGKTGIVLISGGLGPTFDDITRDAVSEFLGRKLIFSASTWKKIETRYRKLGLKDIPEINKKQAYLFKGSTELPNDNGTAPGIIIEDIAKAKVKGGHTLETIILLPGPPGEMAPMMGKSVMPYLKKSLRPGQSKNVSVCFSVAGIPESVVEEKTEGIRKLYPETGMEWTILTRPGIIELWVELPSGKTREIKKDIEGRMQEIFGIDYLGTGRRTPAETLHETLKTRELTLAVAESCTGGLIGHLITDVPGSSEFFSGSFVTYSNVLKKRILKVPRTVLKKHGAVSVETVLAMAKGAKKTGKSKVSLAVTGIAGPSGGTAEKPVGLVWVAAGLPGNRFVSKEFRFSGNRSAIKARAALGAINFLRKEILKAESDNI